MPSRLMLMEIPSLLLSGLKSGNGLEARGAWRYRLFLAGILGLLAMRLEVPLQAAETNLLTSIRRIKQLRPEEAALHVPARVRGVVTGGNPSMPDLFVQNEEGAVYLAASPQALGMVPGDLVEVDGFTDPGGFATQLVPSRIHGSGVHRSRNRIGSWRVNPSTAGWMGCGSRWKAWSTRSVSMAIRPTGPSTCRWR